MPEPAVRRPVAYLIRAWVASATPSGEERLRFMVERVGGEPQRRGFDRFEAMVDYLRAELLEEEQAAADEPAADEAT